MPMRLSAKLLIVLLTLLSGFVAAETVDSFNARDWKQVKDKNGIQVYRSGSDDSRLKMFKGVTIMPLENIFAFLALMEDYEDTSWLHMVTHIEAVGETTESTRKVYTQTSLPWPVKDRDVFTDVVITQSEDYGLHLVYQQSDNPGVVNADYIRIKEAFGYFSVVPIAGTRDVIVTYSAMLDPEGFVPLWAVNIIAGDVAYFTMDRMRKKLSMSKYQNASYQTFKQRP
jgi:hypothetical protein